MSITSFVSVRISSKGDDLEPCKLSVSDSGKVVVLKSNHKTLRPKVNVYDTNGQLLCSFGGQILSGPRDITTVSDGRIVVVQG